MVDTKQSFELMLSYNFKVSEATEISPRVPLFNDLLYENMYEGQFWMLFDSHKKYIASGIFLFIIILVWEWPVT